MSSSLQTASDVKRSVHEVIYQIQRLKTERDAVRASDPDKAWRLQREIFCKFLIIDHLKVRSNSALSPSYARRLEELLTLERKNAQAEDADLKKMTMPGLEGEQSAGKNQSGITFRQFPVKVQEMVLSNLKAASDKVNAAEALAAAAREIKWNLKALKFELILPVLIEKRRELDLEYSDFVKLGRASDAFKTAIKSHYDASLRTTFINRSDDQLVEVKFPPRNAQAGSLPPVLVDDVPLQMNWDSDVSSLRRGRDFLRGLGSHVSSFGFTCGQYDVPEYQAPPGFERFLRLLPNLRKLKVCVPYDYENSDSEPTEWDSGFRDMRLPPLEKLQWLDLTGATNYSLREELLQKYGAQIKGLAVNNESGVLFPPHQGLQFSNLSVLILHGFWNDPTIIDFPKLAGAPIKFIGISMGYRSYMRKFVGEGHSVVLEFTLFEISRFSSTLEELHINLEEADDQVVGPLSWIIDLTFPNVKTLKIQNHPGSWTLPLHFPALEKLTIKHRHLEGKDVFESYSSLELSWNRKKMRSSVIWKLLPDLQDVELELEKGSGLEKMKVTRLECRAFQRRSAAPPQE